MSYKQYGFCILSGNIMIEGTTLKELQKSNSKKKKLREEDIGPDTKLYQHYNKQIDTHIYEDLSIPSSVKKHIISVGKRRYKDHHYDELTFNDHIYASLQSLDGALKVDDAAAETSRTKSGTEMSNSEIVFPEVDRRKLKHTSNFWQNTKLHQFVETTSSKCVCL